MARKKNSMRFMALKEELRNITAFNYIAKATSIVEKILWAIIAICGSLFIYDVVYIQLENWRQNPTLVTKVTKQLSDMPLPAVTFCHKGLHKYGPVERLLNFIDQEKEIPKDVLAIQNEFLKIRFQEVKQQLRSKNFCEWLFSLPWEVKQYNIILSQIPNHHWESVKRECFVSNS